MGKGLSALTAGRVQAQPVENLSSCRKVLKLSKERLDDKVFRSLR